MKRMICLISFLVVILLLAGCSGFLTSDQAKGQDQLLTDGSEQGSERQEILDESSGLADCSIRPDDFAIRYVTWIDNTQPNILDTYTGYLQKDLVKDGTVKVDYTPSEASLQLIYDKVVELQLMDIERTLTSRVLTADETVYSVEPCTYYEITFTVHGMSYKIQDDASASHYTDVHDDASHFVAFILFMNEFIYTSDEFKALPVANGGYI